MAFVNFMAASAATRPFDKDILRVVKGDGGGAAGGLGVGTAPVTEPQGKRPL